ncbi:MAG: M56 family metallopeptidase [Pseudohongiellaceae bacterium]
MTALSVIAALNILEQQHALLFFLIDLSLKATLLLSAAFFIQLLIGKSTPSTKSIVWMMAFAGLILLPLFHQIIPSISFSYSYLSVLENYAGTAQTWEVFAAQIGATARSLFGVALAYLLVSGLLFFYLLSGIFKVIVFSHRAKPFKHEIAQQSLQHLQQVNGFHRPIELLLSPEISSPLTWGLWRHKIIFPLAAYGWSSELLQQSISHELGHVQRADWILQIISRVAISLYWVNPLVWLALRKLLIESEKACDDVAIENSGSPLSYAENLLRLAHNYNAHRTFCAPALLGIQSSLSQRIRHILKQEVNLRSSDTSNILPSLIFAALVVAPFSALGIQFQQMELPSNIHFDPPVISVSFFPNGTREHDFLMAEFR